MRSYAGKKNPPTDKRGRDEKEDRCRLLLIFISKGVNQYRGEKMNLGPSEIRRIHTQKQFKEQAALLYTEDTDINIIYDIAVSLRNKWSAETNKYCAWYQEQKRLAKGKSKK